MEQKNLFAPATFGSTDVKNRIVMAPMTRCRAIGNIPNDLMAEFYKQRSGAGLLITEGTSPSPNGLGYARIPGIFSSEQPSPQYAGRKQGSCSLSCKTCRTNVDRLSHDAGFSSA